MTIEEHPHVTRNPVAASDSATSPPYMLHVPRIQGVLRVAITLEDLLILYATCERLLKEDDE